MAERRQLTVPRIIAAAAHVADRGGLAAVSMRSVGRELGVEAMSLYHHVAGKDALLDGLADEIFARIDLPDSELNWRAWTRDRAHRAREVLAAHPWGLGLIESRSAPGPALLRHHNAVIGCLRTAGFSVRDTSHAISLIDAYVYGFVLTEQNLPFEAGSDANDFAEGLALAADDYPHLVEMMGTLIAHRDYSFGEEFDHGLEMILDQIGVRLLA